MSISPINPSFKAKVSFDKNCPYFLNEVDCAILTREAKKIGTGADRLDVSVERTKYSPAYSRPLAYNSLFKIKLDFHKQETDTVTSDTFMYNINASEEKMSGKLTGVILKRLNEFISSEDIKTTNPKRGSAEYYIAQIEKIEDENEELQEKIINLLKANKDKNKIFKYRQKVKTQLQQDVSNLDRSIKGGNEGIKHLTDRIKESPKEIEKIREEAAIHCSKRDNLRLTVPQAFNYGALQSAPDPMDPRGFSQGVC